MRLWTLHPQYLDAKGLVAAWREALLAQKVLQGQTRGYLNHPQLTRFREQKQPVPSLAAFLKGLADEADRRGYQFDRNKISHPAISGQINETKGQLHYEWQHLLNKLKTRAPELYDKFKNLKLPKPHPLFHLVTGGVRDWEIR
jgi:hypothetical protein